MSCRGYFVRQDLEVFGHIRRSVASIFLILLTGVLPSCKDRGSEFDVPDRGITVGDGVLRGVTHLYGMDINLSTAMLKRQNDYKIAESVPYRYTYEYTALDKSQKEMEVSGHIAGDKEVNAEYYTLTLFEKTIGYDEVKKDMVGKGFVLTFHVATTPGSALTPMTYKGSAQVEPGTFHAYYSSLYDTSKGRNREVQCMEGELTITAVTPTEVSLTYRIRTGNNSEITGKYSGAYRTLDNRSPSSREGKGLKVYAYRDKIHVKSEAFDGKGKYLGGEDKRHYAYTRLSSVINLAAAKVLTPMDAKRAGVEAIDLFLVEDPENQGTYLLTPPIKHPVPAIGYPNNKKALVPIVFPNYTKFMSAPAGFSDEDYRDADKKGFSFVVVDEEIRITSGEKKFILFQTASGQKGVLRITGSFPAKNKRELVYNYETFKQYDEVDRPGGLIVDYKCFVSPVVPNIG